MNVFEDLLEDTADCVDDIKADQDPGQEMYREISEQCFDCRLSQFVRRGYRDDGGLLTIPVRFCLARIGNRSCDRESRRKEVKHML